MKDRIIVLAGAILSLLLVYVLLTPPEIHYDPGAVSRPTSADAGDYGLLGLKTWLEKSGVSTLSWRSRYDRLAEDARLPPRGNFLITSLPHGLPARTRELKSLHEWLAAGNHALILAAEYDSPDWQSLGFLQFASADSGEVLRQFGFEFSYPEPEDEDEAESADDPAEEAQPESAEDDAPGFFQRLLQEEDVSKAIIPQRESVSFVAVLRHPRLGGVAEVATRSYDISAEKPFLTAADDSYALALGLLRRPAGETVFWEAPLGEGAIWLSAYPDLFGNLTLGMADNSRLLANLLAFGLQAGGYVIFDDFHFGMSDLYDPQAFFADRRLHNTLLFILGFWILYLLGYTNRLGPPVTDTRPARASDFVESFAGLLARRLTTAAVARGLIGHFFNELRALHRLPENSRPAWELLAARCAPAAGELALLRTMADGCDNGRPPKLRELISVLQKLRNELQ